MCANTAKILQIWKQVEARKKEEEEKYGGGGTGGPEITDSFVGECLDANELGDGLLYAAMHRGKFLFNATAGSWMKWVGHHWEEDQKKGHLAAMENVSMRYLEESKRLQKKLGDLDPGDKEGKRFIEARQDMIKKRINRLRSKDGRAKPMEFSATNDPHMAIFGYMIDTHPMLLPCATGVLNLCTGELEPGRPEDYLLKSSPIPWKGLEEPAPLWEATLPTIYDNDHALIEYVKRLFGYSITGLTTEHILPVFTGQGRNGKGVIFGILAHVLGPLAGAINTEMILDQGKGTRNASAPSPDIMALRGMRIAIGSETDPGRRFSPSKIKLLTGGDQLVGRNPNDRFETRFDQTQKLFILTNDIPSVSSEDYAFWARMRIIQHPFSFVDNPTADNERPRDKNLGEKLKAEASGILAWLVRGCLEWQRYGLVEPPSVVSATSKQQKTEDYLTDFLDECCVIDEKSEVGASKLYDAFAVWYEKNVSKRVPKQRRFGTMLGKRFESEKVGGVYRYYGLHMVGE